ncbi:hypothetical protein [Streptomyces sp. SHP 1-2]|uniref:hypothetical protein n=1 Tax=Streptomyces sp. SHP 1-2 TaxID=2769489 RepID=UPI002240E6D5|nr:hypothetical protein [Streptomyces sp. SHP 1-2]
MRPSRRSAPAAPVVLLTLLCVLLPPHGAASRPRAAAAPEPFGASCRVRTDGSEVTADCRNPYPEPDLLALHVECLRWWDPDADGVPVEAGPAGHVRLTGRCWHEVHHAWVSHGRTG